MVRRNTSNTPAMETEQAQMSVAQFYIPAQRANGTLVVDEAGLPDEKADDGSLLPGALQYYAETGDDDPDTADLGGTSAPQEDWLMDERTIAKPHRRHLQRRGRARRLHG